MILLLLELQGGLTGECCPGQVEEDPSLVDRERFELARLPVAEHRSNPRLRQELVVIKFHSAVLVV